MYIGLVRDIPELRTLILHRAHKSMDIASKIPVIRIP